MTVVHYKQTNDTKKIINIVEVDLTNSVNLLFGTLTRLQIEELDKLIKEIPHKRSPTPDEHEKMYTLKNTLQKSAKSIHLDIKCNSQQSRLQCSFNHFQDFLNSNSSRIIAKSSSDCKFRGLFIIPEIISEKRTFSVPVVGDIKTFFNQN